MRELLFIGGGGFIGSIGRFLLSRSVQRAFPEQLFPLGTLTVNVAGCFLIGLLAALAKDRGVFGPQARLFLIVGVLGGFTTFSAFAYESLELASGGDFFRFGLNIVLSVVAGLGAAWLGMAAVKLL
ncbi:MAG: fluoride efflux transporter CrcB [Elusimicrobiaceae bacterium]